MKRTAAMAYGLRRYETSQRVWWLIAMLIALAAAYPIASLLCSAGTSSSPGADPHKVDFWMQTGWIHQGVLGAVVGFLVVFLFTGCGVRCIWLLVQWAGSRAAAGIFEKHLPVPKGANDSLLRLFQTEPERLLPASQLRHAVMESPLRWLSMAHRRIRLLFSGGLPFPSADELRQREHRAELVDWHLVGASWEPFLWVAKVVPFLALAHSAWLFYWKVEPVLRGEKEVRQGLEFILPSLLPFIQVLGLVVLFTVVYGVLSRAENLFLARLDALFYDQVISRLPFQSSDTLIVLESLAAEFEKIHRTLRRMEERLERVTGSGQSERSRY